VPPGRRRRENRYPSTALVRLRGEEIDRRKERIVKYINEAPWDRIGRVVLGIVMVWLGLAVVDGTWGVVLTVVGFIPLVTGIVGWCPLYALFHTGTKAGDHRSMSV
jgi:Inner membrane protein YgaP-like, transmembrane domain